jgi:hypothetical protein
MQRYGVGNSESDKSLRLKACGNLFFFKITQANNCIY